MNIFLQQPDGDCQKLFLLREFQRLLGIAQSGSDFGTGDACFELPVPDPNTFCAGALFTEPADLDIDEPNPVAVMVDSDELLFTTVRNAAGSPMSGRQVAFSVLPGSEGIFDVTPGGLVLGLAPGAGTLLAEVVNACVEVTADVFVAPAATGRWSVSTTERRIGSSRQECQDNQLPLGYTVDFSIGEPDFFEPGSLGVTWSVPFGGGFFCGNLWAYVLRVGGIRQLVTPGGVFNANISCDIMPLGAESGSGKCDWSWIDFGGGCFGEDDITIQRPGPIP